MTITHDNLDPVEQVRFIKRDVIQTVLPMARREGEREGILGPDPTLMLRNRGRQTRRQYSTLLRSVDYLKIGTQTKPLEFDWLGEGNWADVFEAARYFWDIWTRMAPRLTGRYLFSGTASVAGSPWSRTAQPARYNLQPDSRWIFVAFADYASTLEANERQGIVYKAMRRTQRKYPDLAMRFYYVNGNRYQHPAVEMGLPGAFASNDSKGRGSRNKRRARAARRSRR